MPSGVISKAQEKNTTIGKPAINAVISIFMIQAGASKDSRAISPTCTSSQAATAYAMATRTTLRRLSSANRLMGRPCLAFP